MKSNTAVASNSLLVVDDEPDLRTLYELTLLREGYDVETAGTVKDAWERLGERAFSAVITDMRLPDGTGLDLLRRLEEAGRREKTIVITAYGSAENAVEALKAGAYDYLAKPVDLKQFRLVVASALAQEGPAATGVAAQQQKTDASAVAGLGSLSPLDRMAGESEPIRQVRGLVQRVARSMAPVLVSGESGTGKELVARAIHEVSPRGARPFVAVNCSAIPEHLLEAEFFGYRKGAFTGANEDREGFFQAANGGTLFLDEIGDLPLVMQSKLLRSIQERAVRPVGAVAEAPVDVRVVSATHRDLADEVQRGRFRQDLYYRLNVIQIRVPSLRERMSDLPLIAHMLLTRIAEESRLPSVPQLSAHALEALTQHAFPGNVRELENLLHRAVALSGREIIDVDDVDLPPAGDSFTAVGTVPVAVSESAVNQSVVQDGPAPAARSSAHALPASLTAYLDDVERGILVRALELHGFNRTAAGASLGLTLRQMRYRMARLGIHAPDGSAPDEDAA